jgi:CHAT domain-containing protein
VIEKAFGAEAPALAKALDNLASLQDASRSLAARQTQSWVDLGAAEPIDAAVNDLRAALRDPRRQDIHRLARAVDDQLMRPVRALLGNTAHVLVSPDGQLNLLPFAAPVDERGRYLVERFQFTYLTSGRDLLRLQSNSPSETNAAVVVADPAFGERAKARRNWFRRFAVLRFRLH